MHDVVLGREVLDLQTADRVPIHAHASRNAPETLTRSMPTLDLLPARDPGRSPVLGFLLARTQWSVGIGYRWWLSHCDRNPATPGTHHLLHGLARILEQVEAISNLTHSRRALPCSFAIRLGRSLTQLIELMTQLQERGAGFRSLTEQIDTTTSGGKLIFHIFGALAEFERNLIRERTMAGLAAARARGRLGGRPKLPNTDRKIQMARQLHNDPRNSISNMVDSGS